MKMDGFYSLTGLGSLLILSYSAQGKTPSLNNIRQNFRELTKKKKYPKLLFTLFHTNNFLLLLKKTTESLPS
jgi:3-dehydroquinate dehydratase